ncbi:legumain [Paragonimus westermani]|uniref:Legumain n=1 Tax=Paragonimus westermani TaxID=34504 RepID=A0A5J4N8V8_9TREM|nr:legumain [Paragonimus westermani]
MEKALTSFITFVCLIGVSVALNAFKLGDTPAGNWAVLVAGSNGWYNYRHQADICHAYQILTRRGIPKENIITFMYDDIARNEFNPFQGEIYNDYEHKDVYAGVEIDYKGEEVTPEMFMRVMKADSELNATGKKVLKRYVAIRRRRRYQKLSEFNWSAFLSPKSPPSESEHIHNIVSFVIHSGPDDNVFVYFTDHGAEGMIGFPNGLHDIHQLSLQQQYRDVKDATQSSHVREYGDMTKPVHTKRSTTAHVFALMKHAIEARTEEDHSLAMKKLHRVMQVPEVAQHVTQFHQLCRMGYQPDVIITSVMNVCT